MVVQYCTVDQAMVEMRDIRKKSSVFNTLTSTWKHYGATITCDFLKLFNLSKAKVV